MVKRILFVSHYAMPPAYEMREKTLKHAYYLQKKGYEVTIVSASTIHNTNVNLMRNTSTQYRMQKYDGIPFIHIKCCDYHDRGTVWRILNLLQFAVKFRLIGQKFPLPDVIIAEANCINYSPIYYFCRDNKIPFYVDVRDLWPESIVEYLGFSKNNPVIRYLYHREKKMYMRSDGIIFSMAGGKQYIKEKGWDTAVPPSKIHHINNGVDLKAFEYNKDHFQIQDSDLTDAHTFKVIYCGSIRLVNGLGTLVDTAAELKRMNRGNIKILVYGDGDERASLEQRCKREKLDNIIFKGFVEKKYIPFIISCGDLNFIQVKQTAIMRFGSSLNKLFEYLASGKPVLSDLQVRYDIIKRYGAGTTMTTQAPADIANEMIRYAEMDPKEYETICQNARRAAKAYDYKRLTDKLIAIITPKKEGCTK